MLNCLKVYTCSIQYFSMILYCVLYFHIIKASKQCPLSTRSKQLKAAWQSLLWNGQQADGLKPNKCQSRFGKDITLVRADHLWPYKC